MGNDDQRAESSSGVKRRKVEQREEQSFLSSATTSNAAASTSNIPSLDEQQPYGTDELHPDDATRGSIISPAVSRQISSSRKKFRKQRSETDILTTAYGKGKQRSLEEEESRPGEEDKEAESSGSDEDPLRSNDPSSSQAADSSGSTMPDLVFSSQRRESARPSTGQGSVTSGTERESSRRYLLHILQQPTIGCAFGSNLLSRLAIAPPLIVQLQAIDRAGREVSLDNELPFLICRVQLTDEDGQPIEMLTAKASSTSSPTPESTSIDTSTTSAPTSVRLLYGTLVASPMQLHNLDHRPAIIFVFPEISIRSRGRFQLQVVVTRIPLPSLGSMTASTVATASTEPFNVVLSADYNVPDVTDVTRHFARQGVGLLLPPDLAD